MPKKVFELANEIGLRPLDLVDKLKDAGLSVRNHMSSLSDDELVKAMELFGGLEEKEEADKTRKKVVKKKKVVANKVVRKKVQTVKAVESSDETEELQDDKSVIVKRKVVRRRSAGEEEASGDDLKITSFDDVEEAAETFDEPVLEKRSLEVVEHPLPEEEKEDEFETSEQESSEEVDDIFKEKMHTFTPVFIPEEKIAEEGLDSTESEESKSSTKRKFKKTKLESEGDFDEESPLDEKGSKKRFGGLAAAISKPRAASKSRDLSNERTIEELKDYTLGMGQGYYIPAKRKKVYEGPKNRTIKTEVKDSKRVITLSGGGCTTLKLAQKLSVKFKELVDKCLDLNLLISQDDFIGINLANEIAQLYNYRIEDKSFQEEDIIQKDEKKNVDDLPLRNPVITVMGHVDHGKTTLLDYIRDTKVVAGEAGGITQHIGAYTVPVKDTVLTFIDTPGHAAFASMRQRGADVTDIVILVVAADDGVMPQTEESIRFCKNAKVPVIVAINKMDKEGAKPDRIKQALVEYGLTPEDWGGDTQYIEISALKGDGVDNLLEAIQLQAEMMELRANPKGGAEGVVIESRVESGRGSVTTILIQKGTLTKGDSVVVGETYGRARIMMDHSGNALQKAGPATPVQIVGLETAPGPGDILNVVKNEREARKIVANRVEKRKKLESIPRAKVNSLEDFFSTAVEGEKKVLKLIVRTDVQGSFEAIKQAIEVLGNNEVGVEVIGGGVGAINDNDVLLASSVAGYIIGFNMRPITTARRLAEEKGVDIKNYSIIYELINDITLALEGMLEPDRVEVFIGRAEVRDVFSIPRIGVIAGSSVIDGKIQRGCSIRLLRDGKIVFDGKMASLKRFKDDVKEVQHGYECGIGLEGFNDIKVQDVFEAYIMEEKKRKLSEDTNLIL